MNTYNYIPQEAIVIKKEKLCDDIFAFRLKINSKKTFHSIPGQFVMVSIPGFGEVPIGITGSPAKNEITIGIRSAGMVTKRFCSLEVGESLGVSEALGNGFPLAKLKNRHITLIAGGMGLSPLRSLIEYLGQNKNYCKSLTVLIGAKCPERLLYQDEYKNWEKFAKIIKTVDQCDPKWSDFTGKLADFYQELGVKAGSVIIACGPPVVYPSILSYFGGKLVPDKDIYFMLERKMKCGVGKCQHCTCGKLYTCIDGPVFSYAQLKNNQEAF